MKKISAYTIYISLIIFVSTILSLMTENLGIVHWSNAHYVYIATIIIVWLLTKGTILKQIKIIIYKIYDKNNVVVKTLLEIIIILFFLFNLYWLFINSIGIFCGIGYC